MIVGSELQVVDRHKLYSIIIDYSITILMSSYHRIKSKRQVLYQDQGDGGLRFTIVEIMFKSLR